MIQLRKITIVSACLVLFIASSLVLAAEAKTSVSDLLAKMPADNTSEGQMLCAELVKLGPEGMMEICRMLVPPGTGDEALSTAQVLGSVDGVVIVTTPQELAVVDVRKCLTFCKQLNLPVLGIIENMSGFVCPHCQKRTDVFTGQGGRQTAIDFGVPFLGSIPMDPAVAQACDAGRPFIDFDKDSPTAQALAHVFEPLIKENEKSSESESEGLMKEPVAMKIAIPLVEGKLSAHFGHCEKFAVVDVDPESKTIRSQDLLAPPAHEPGVLPAWLAEQGVSVIIAGGMGQRAQGLFTQQNIEVVVGAPAEMPEALVSNYLAGTLQVGDNICDH